MAQIHTTTVQITRPAVVSYHRLHQLNTISHRQVNITAQYNNNNNNNNNNKELATNSTIAQALIQTVATFNSKHKQAAPTANIHTITIQQHTH